MRYQENRARAGNFRGLRRTNPSLRKQENNGTATSSTALSAWAPFALAFAADLIVASGFIPPSRVGLVRAAVIYVVYQEWALAMATGFFLPRLVPLTAVCFLRTRWLDFWHSAQEQLKGMAAAAGERAAAATANAQDAGTGGGSGQRTRGRGGATPAPARGPRGGPRPGKISGYDVSEVSGEEVVELSSWTDNRGSSSEAPGARRRAI